MADLLSLSLATLLAGGAYPSSPPGGLPDDPRPADDSKAGAAAQSPPAAGPAVPAPLLLDLGPELPGLRIPRDEELVFEAVVNLAVFEGTVGRVTLSAGVEPYRPGLILPRADEAGGAARETGWLKALAEGDHALYTMDADIRTRFLPQDWPRIKYYYEHRGSERRRRELLIGSREGKPVASYRSDTEHGAPRGMRIWRKPEARDLPRDGVLDTMGAVYLLRSMISEDRERLEFLMLTKLKMWDVTVTRGQRRVQEVPAGRFDAVEVVLITQRHAGDEPGDSDRFEGLFGMHGAIHIWVDAQTGIPVRVVGDVPLGPFNIGCDVRLASYRGTPAEFAPLRDSEGER